MNPQLEHLIKCQRNWDLSRSIPQEHVDLIQEYVSEPPQQGNHKYFNTVIIHNQSAKQQLYRICSPVDDPISEPPEYFDLQPQILANLVIVWTVPKTKCVQGSLSTCCNETFAVGFNGGITAQLAEQLGYATSFTKCGPYKQDAWHSWLTENNLDLDDNWQFEFALGIGYSNENVPHNVDHLDSNRIHGQHKPRDLPHVVVLK